MDGKVVIATENLTKRFGDFTAVNEITGTGYTAGGELVTGATINTDPTSGVLYISFNNIEVSF